MLLPIEIVVGQYFRSSTIQVVGKFHPLLFRSRLLFSPIVAARRLLYLSSPYSLPNKKTLSNWAYKKINRYKPLYVEKIMAELDPKIAAELEPFRQSVKEQGDLIRQLKADNAPELDIKKAVAELKNRKRVLEEKTLQLAPPDSGFERAKMEDLIKRRFFFDNSFAIYGGITGQFDFGPMGCSIKNNMIDLWRKHFVLQEQMLEVDCTILTPEPVLKASGHVERFADLMVKDLATGECFRLDHLIKAHLEKLASNSKTSDEIRQECQSIVTKLDGLSKEQMNEILQKFKIKSPLTGNDLSEAIEFNLMFSTMIGPSGQVKGFLRPETAQGIFVNFKRLLEFNHRRLPFAAAQVGNAFRNEISPRSGLIRVREFTLAEIEHFVDPSNKSHPKYETIADLELNLYTACNQMDGKASEMVRIRDAVDSKIIANETLAYFIGRIYLFMVKVGVDPKRLRFRQHMDNEMAHYATDCWDAECLTSYGWVECVGCADRSCFDLLQHTKTTNVKLVAEKDLPAPKIVNVVEIVPNKGLMGKHFKANAQKVMTRLSVLDESEIKCIEQTLNDGQNEFILNLDDENKVTITKEMVTIKRYEKKVHVEEFTPGVIEPSFGIGRIMHTLFEHSFRIRQDDEQRTYFALPAVVCPIKCSLLPLSNHNALKPFVTRLSTQLSAADISFKFDDTGSIGKRYARTDEISVPFAITIDFDSCKDEMVTLRERDSTEQIRLPIKNVVTIVKELSMNLRQWDDVRNQYGIFDPSQSSSEPPPSSQ
ncbi:glycine--tRNA ligase [Dermatophagoides farinae]|uniref:glycine--tRNA ligase n=1 Tax=Dermatophagoides farinae TaxID=6954 RepID=UPI003F6048CA